MPAPGGLSPARRRRGAKLAITGLRGREPLTAEDIAGFLAEHASPIVEGEHCTFLYRGDADAVSIRHGIYGLPPSVPLRRLRGGDLWYAVIDLPSGSRMQYKLEVRRQGTTELVDDPLNPRHSYSPLGSSSVCLADGYQTPSWAIADPEARTGELVELTVPSRALRRDSRLTVYLPARFRRAARYPLLVVHDGADYLHYASLQTVLDNLIHRLDMAEVIAALTHPGERLREYANDAAHSRFINTELPAAMEDRFPLIGQPAARCLMGSSFGAVAALAAAYRAPGRHGALLLQSGSFAFTDIGSDHGGGPAFDPVVRFVNAFRERPRHVVSRVFMSCGVYEPLIYRNRSMVPVLQSTGMEVRYVESRDGHNWESWRDRLRDGLSWIFPGAQKLVYE